MAETVKASPARKRRHHAKPPVITRLTINGVEINSTPGIVVRAGANAFALTGTDLPYGADIKPASVTFDFKSADGDAYAVTAIDSTSTSTSCTGIFYYLRSPSVIPPRPPGGETDAKAGKRKHATIRKSKLSVTITAPSPPTPSAPYPNLSVNVTLPA